MEGGSINNQTTTPNFFQKIYQAAFHPSAFFEAIQQEPLKGALFYFLILGWLLNSIWYTFNVISLIPTFIGQSFLIKYLVALGAILVITGLTLIIFHLVARMFKGQGTFSDTLKVIVYGSTPSYFLIGFTSLVGLWSLIIQVKGFKKLHQLSTGNAIGVVIFSAIVMFVIISIISGQIISSESFLIPS